MNVLRNPVRVIKPLNAQTVRVLSAVLVTGFTGDGTTCEGKQGYFYQVTLEELI